MNNDLKGVISWSRAKFWAKLRQSSKSAITTAKSLKWKYQGEAERRSGPALWSSRIIGLKDWS